MWGQLLFQDSDNQNSSNYKSINSMQFIVTSFNVLWNQESEKKYYQHSSLTQIDFYTSQQCCPLYILSYYIVSHCNIFILVFSGFFFQPLCQKILFILLISVLYFGVFFCIIFLCITPFCFKNWPLGLGRFFLVVSMFVICVFILPLPM